MSAYIVDNRTINRILAYLMHNEPRIIREMASNFTESGFLTDVGVALRELNVAAVSARYPDDAPDELPGPIGDDDRLLPYAFTEELPPTPVEAYKALSCLIYQCSEGNIPQAPLYQALEDVRARVAAEVICHLPAYDAAAWG